MVDALKEEIIGYYEGFGYWKAGAWEEDSNKLFGADEAVDVYKVLIKHGLIPPYNEDFVFLSPTANSSIHETAIWSCDNALRTGRNLFLAGDIREIHPSPTNLTELATYQNPKHRFNYFRWDAEDLPLAPGSVDLIWDRKGWVWHLAKHIKNPDRLFGTFANYRRMLKSGGSIVLDAVLGFDSYLGSLPADQVFKLLYAEVAMTAGISLFRPSDLYLHPPYQYEESTVDTINILSRGIWDILAEDFTILDMGKEYYRIRCLVKR